MAFITGSREVKRVYLIFLFIISGFAIFFTYREYYVALYLPQSAIRYHIDYTAYYVCAQMLKTGNLDIYDIQKVNLFTRHLGFPEQANPGRLVNYPPSHYMLMTLVTPGNYSVSFEIWFWLSQLFVVAGVIMIYLTVKDIYGKEEKFLWIFLPVFSLQAIFFSPTIDCIIHGQISCLLFLLSTCSLYFYVKGQYCISAIPLGLAAAIKGLPIFFIILFIFRKRWSAALSMVSVFFFLLILPEFLWSWKLLGDFIAIHSRYFIDFSNVYHNQSLTSLLHLYVPVLSVYQLFLGRIFLSFLFIGISLYCIRDTGNIKERLLEFSMFSVLFSIITPFAWTHHHVTLILPLFCAFPVLIMEKFSSRKLLFISLTVIYIVISCFDNAGVVMLDFVKSYIDNIRVISLWASEKTAIIKYKIPFIAILLLWCWYLIIIRLLHKNDISANNSHLNLQPSTLNNLPEGR
jgi:hypothetical protein